MAGSLVSQVNYLKLLLINKSRKKSKRKSKYAQKQMKMKTQQPKPVEHYKSSAKGKVHSNTGTNFFKKIQNKRSMHIKIMVDHPFLQDSEISKCQLLGELNYGRVCFAIHKNRALRLLCFVPNFIDRPHHRATSV